MFSAGDSGETKTYTFEEVRGILSDKSRKGHREAVKALISKYGGTQLSDYKDDPGTLAKLAKDGAAGAVLVSAIASAIIGLAIFIPHLLSKL